MVCGVKNNAYHTLRSIRFITSDGKTYDTVKSEDYNRFLVEQNSLAEGLQQCKRNVIDNPDLSSKIREKYKIKNTMGYSVNALLDYEHPLDIFAHLLVGSEGTL
jgi:D-lactate dehydrogenase